MKSHRRDYWTAKGSLLLGSFLFRYEFCSRLEVGLSWVRFLRGYEPGCLSGGGMVLALKVNILAPAMKVIDVQEIPLA